MQRCSPWILLGILIVLVPLLCCGLPMGLATRANNARLQRFANNLYSYPLPPRTEEIRRNARVTLLGNGNHCDYAATRHLVTDLSREEIEAYYEDVVLPAVSDKSEYARDGLVWIDLEFDDQLTTDGRLHFAITITDIGYPAGWDIRCH